MDFRRVKISTTVPQANAEQLRQALGQAGAGQIGEYSFCSFSVTGKGRFMPTDNAHPHIGQANQLETVEEEQIEVVCSRDIARHVVDTLKQAHPYEEVIIDILPLIDKEAL